MTTGHGGARPGAGRRPKALAWAREIAEAEGRIVAALPKIIGTLVSKAETGDVAAARYLLDRIFGRPPIQATAPAEDRRRPYTEDDFAHDERMRDLLPPVNF